MRNLVLEIKWGTLIKYKELIVENYELLRNKVFNNCSKKNKVFNNNSNFWVKNNQKKNCGGNCVEIGNL